MIITPIKTRIFLEGENLLDFIEEYIFFSHPQPDPKGQESLKYTFEEGDILVITSKIVALSEGRTFVAHTPDEKLEYIQHESSWYRRTKYVHLTLHDNMPMANAGIDESNGNGKCIMLPKDSYLSAKIIRNQIQEKFLLRNFGVIITDSRTLPFRNGTLGISLGHAGFEAIRDYIGKPDIFGRPFQYARTNIPDALAVSAVHLMGEGDERQPLVIIKNPKVRYTDKDQNAKNLVILPEEDMYSPLYTHETVPPDDFRLTS